MTQHQAQQQAVYVASRYLNLSYTQAKRFRLRITNETGLIAYLKPQLQKLPTTFRNAFATLLGHCVCPGRELVDWQEFSTAVKSITYGPDNLSSLASWPTAPCVDIMKAPDPRHAAYKILEVYHDLKAKEPGTFGAPYSWAMRLSLEKTGICLSDALSSHLMAAASIAAGAFFLKSGSLHLIDTTSIPRSQTYSGGDDLLIVRKTSSGMYMIAWPSSFQPLAPSEIKGMKQLIRDYKGRKVTGKFRFLSTASSARLAKSIGLTVDGDYARLAPC